MAGIMAARDNGTGGRGVASRAGFVGCGIFNNLALEDAIDGFTRDAPSIAIANNSWGFGYESHHNVSQLWDDALETGLKNGFDGKGTLYVFSAGNGHAIGRHPNESKAKSSYAQVLVCAVDADGERAFYSGTGYVLWVCAPSGVVTTDSCNRYFESFRGTSASAPTVSGVAAPACKNDPNTGWDRACRYEPDVARVLEQRENRGGGVNVCARPRRKPDRVAGLTATRAAATAVCAPSRTGTSRLPVLVIAPIA